MRLMNDDFPSAKGTTTYTGARRRIEKFVNAVEQWEESKDRDDALRIVFSVVYRPGNDDWIAVAALNDRTGHFTSMLINSNICVT